MDYCTYCLQTVPKHHLTCIYTEHGQSGPACGWHFCDQCGDLLDHAYTVEGELVTFLCQSPNHTIQCVCCEKVVLKSDSMSGLDIDMCRSCIPLMCLNL